MRSPLPCSAGCCPALCPAGLSCNQPRLLQPDYFYPLTTNPAPGPLGSLRYNPPGMPGKETV